MTVFKRGSVSHEHSFLYIIIPFLFLVFIIGPSKSFIERFIVLFFSFESFVSANSSLFFLDLNSSSIHHVDCLFLFSRHLISRSLHLIHHLELNWIY